MSAPFTLVASALGGSHAFSDTLLLFADVFPRGGGFYFSIPRLFAVVGLYLVWVKTCAWVNEDVHDVSLPENVWNPVMIGSGMVGLLFVWLFPMFWVSFFLLLIVYLSSTLAYVNVRNQRVADDEQILTERHLRELLERYLRIRLPDEDGEQTGGPPLRFLGKSFATGEDDPSRVARAEGTKGYKAAREMVYEAITLRATDIHMEPSREEMQVRFRIDGILQPSDPFSRQMGDAVINIFKVLSNMDITERRKPQDGSFSAQCENKTVDFRVATAGSVVGEKLVMRILDKSKQLTSLTQLGMRDKVRDQIHGIVQQPHGMLIVCGPTGAGKSTTLYACLNEIDRYQRNVITIENPVECQVSNVTQIEVNPKAGKTFATELRSILRQDPDVIMVGEIRDQETAEISCQAAQTGHIVFTTVHANDTVTALVRMIDLQVSPTTLASAISAILGQRLVRLLCPKCKVRYKPNPEMLRKANLPVDKIKYFYRPPETGDKTNGAAAGDGGPCPHCGGMGYLGRSGIFELLVVNDKIKDMLREDPSPNAIRQEAVKSGMKYLQEDGLRLVIEGKTSIQEVLRVCK
jgi:type II secretory ATPase GspE/PulE/Tfp pilus assembly ATPase PilB-like protein